MNCGSLLTVDHRQVVVKYGVNHVGSDFELPWVGGVLEGTWNQIMEKDLSLLKDVPTQVKDPELVKRRRLQIVDAAVELFIKKGFHKTTTRQIAQANSCRLKFVTVFIGRSWTRFWHLLALLNS